MFQGLQTPFLFVKFLSSWQSNFHENLTWDGSLLNMNRHKIFWKFYLTNPGMVTEWYCFVCVAL
jgi:hypothetical protein